MFLIAYPLKLQKTHVRVWLIIVLKGDFTPRACSFLITNTVFYKISLKHTSNTLLGLHRYLKFGE